MKLLFNLLLLICLSTTITSVYGKYYGVSYQEITCGFFGGDCSIYKIYEIGSKETNFKLNYTRYGDSIGKNFKPFEKVIRGEFIDGNFQVEKVYRVLAHPDRVFEFSNENKFFKIDSNSNSTIFQLNFESNNNQQVTSIDHTYGDEIRNIQMEWIDKKIKTGEAVFSTINNILATSSGSVHIDYLWLSIPDPVGCPKLNDRCSFPFILTPTYSRDENRCMSFTGCVRILKNPICNLIDFTGCPSGYKKVSFANGDSACPKFYCDPDW